MEAEHVEWMLQTYYELTGEHTCLTATLLQVQENVWRRLNRLPEQEIRDLLIAAGETARHEDLTFSDYEKLGYQDATMRDGIGKLHFFETVLSKLRQELQEQRIKHQLYIGPQNTQQVQWRYPHEEKDRVLWVHPMSSDAPYPRLYYPPAAEE